MKITTAAVVAATLAAAGASSAQATWQTFSSGTMDISDQVSLARTSDGVLHIGWFRRGDDELQTPVTASGTVGPAVPIVSGWTRAGDPVLLAQGSALTAVWSGSPTLTTGNPQDGIDQATSADGGATWAVGPTAISTDGFGSRPAATYAGGTLLFSYLVSGGTIVRAGLDPAVPSGTGYASGSDQQLAASATGEATVAWCTLTDGIFAAPVDPTTGAPAGAAAHMPGTGFCDAAARLPLVARAGGGFYITAPSEERDKVLVWKVGSPTVATIAGGSQTKEQVAMAAAPDGRLWAGWDDDRTGKLVVVRSNKSATRWGAAVSVKPPAGTVFQLNLDAQLDRVDAVIRNRGEDSSVSLLTEQIRPGLTLVATGGKTPSFRVLDAGDPVPGATVKVAGRTLTTNAAGRTGTDLKPGRYTVVASKTGYVGAKARVRAL